MASQQLAFRAKPPLVAAIDAAAERNGISRSEEMLNTLEDHYLGHAPEQRPAERAPAAASAPKIDRARAALAQAETRQGVKARLDTSMVPVHDGSKRPAYQRGQAGQGKAGKGRGR